MMTQPIKVGIIGDYDSDNVTHTATVDALTQAAKSLAFDLETEWLPTEALNKDTIESSLKRFNGFWGAPGSPYKSMHGALKAIQLCRENEWPFLGT
jgi:CTP synthase (UTP-ammonia lyase)